MVIHRRRQLATLSHGGESVRLARLPRRQVRLEVLRVPVTDSNWTLQHRPVELAEQVALGAAGGLDRPGESIGEVRVGHASSMGQHADWSDWAPARNGAREWRWAVLARPEGFEPPTLWSEATCSSPLSYGRADAKDTASHGRTADACDR